MPQLTRPSRIPPGRRVFTVISRLVAAVVPWLWRRRRGQYASIEASRSDISRRLRLAAERLGPTYIKLGQIISSGEGLFPPELVERVQEVPRPGAGRAVRRRFARWSRKISAHRLEDVFESFDTHAARRRFDRPGPRGARLRTGEEVVVKVQRPAVARLVRKDLRVMAWLAPHLVGRIPIASLANPPALVELFAETIVEELDFRMEAANMLDIATMLHELDQTGYVVPRPHPTLVTRRVLVMERIDGFNFDDVVGMKDAGIDTEAVVRTAMIAFMEGAMIYGDLPRRPARRQPVRAARRAYGAARLRHRRPADRRSADSRSCG